jgi:hypothetical protein
MQTYSKLSREKSRLEKEGLFTFGGWPGRTKDEELALRKVGTASWITSPTRITSARAATSTTSTATIASGPSCCRGSPG